MNSSAIVRLILSPFTSSSVFLDIGHCAQHSEERNPHSILTSPIEIYIIIAIVIFTDRSLTIYRKRVLVGIQLLLSLELLNNLVKSLLLKVPWDTHGRPENSQ